MSGKFPNAPIPMHGGEPNPQGSDTGSEGHRTDYFLIAFFFAFLGFPLLMGSLGLDPAVAPVENRTLASMPGIPQSLDELDRFPQAFENHWNDHIGFRNSLIRARNSFKYSFLGDSPNREKVLLGEDGWFFDGFLAETAFRSFSPEQLNAKAKVLQERKDWLAARGIRYLVVIIPSTYTLYPEHLPEHLRATSAKSRFREAVSFLEKESKVEILDLHQTLERGKKSGRNYQKLDIHWNGEGAVQGYRAILDRIDRWFPKMQTAPPAAISFRREIRPGWYFNDALSLSSDLLEEDVVAVVERPRHRILDSLQESAASDIVLTEVDDPRLPRAMFFIDSFGDYLIPLLSEHFERTLWVRREPKFSTALIEAESPELVISQIYELNLAGLEEPPLESPGKTNKIDSVQLPGKVEESPLDSRR